MEDISNTIFEKTKTIQSFFDKIRDDIHEKLDFASTRSEQAINIGLSTYSEISIIKDKLKALEEGKTLPSTSEPPSPTKKSSVSDSQLEQTFNSLVKQWKEDTINLSSMQKMVLHPSYQQIIGLGPKAISLILNELKNEPDFWFWALRALARANPVTDNMAGDISTMTRVWLEWGREHGYH